MLHFFRYSLLLLATFLSFEAAAQSEGWRDIYTVKKKDTIYGIAKAYGITMEELMEANPEMLQPKFKLKKDMRLRIPAEKKAVKEEAPKVEASKAKTMPGQTLRVGVLLPLHDNDGDGKRMVEYYRGLLIGCDSLRAAGISTDVSAWNVPIDADIRTTLLNDKCRDCDIIFGPLYTKQLADLADFCRRNEIKLVVPFSISGNEVERNPAVFQVYQNGIRIAESSVRFFMNHFSDCNPVIIDCNDTTSQKGVFTSALRKELEARRISYSITNLRSSEEAFKKAFSSSRRNVVIMNTARSQDLNMVFRRLNELRVAKPNLEISMFGYPEWISYESVFRELFHKYDAYVPSTYYYNKGILRVGQLELSYQKWFGEKMQEKYIPRFAITGYDHAQFFLRGLHEKGSNFSGQPGESSYKHFQTPLSFQPAAQGGGMQNTAFMLVHYRADKIIETINK